MSENFTFNLKATSGKARLGEITMPRGTIRTPAFMPVGTVGTVKAMYLDQVKEGGADIILGNTYHLMLRPGPERVARLGGLHRRHGCRPVAGCVAPPERSTHPSRRAHATPWP